MCVHENQMTCCIVFLKGPTVTVLGFIPHYDGISYSHVTLYQNMYTIYFPNRRSFDPIAQRCAL